MQTARCALSSECMIAQSCMFDGVDFRVDRQKGCAFVSACKQSDAYMQVQVEERQNGCGQAIQGNVGMHE